MESHVVLIFPYGRSGSLFIQSLLDGHPELICFPPIYTFSFLQKLSKSKGALNDADALLDVIFSYSNGRMLGRVQPDRKGKMDIFSYSNIDLHSPFTEQEFRDRFSLFFRTMIIEEDEPILRAFKTMVYAFDAALNKHNSIAISKSKKVVFQAHSFDWNWINWFAGKVDKLSLLHMVRKPLSTFHSDIKSKLAQRDLGIGAFTANLLSDLAKHILTGPLLFKKKGVDHFVVKLEDVHAGPDKLLARLATKLSIGSYDGFFTSSFSGRSWTNFIGKEHVPTFNPMPASTSYADLLTERDVDIIGSMLGRRYDCWNYDRDFNQIANPFEQIEQYSLLIEYLPYIRNDAQRLAAYEKQVPVPRNENLKYFLQYPSFQSAPLAEVL